MISSGRFGALKSRAACNVAVAPTGNPNEFQVIAVAEAFDNATTSPGNLLSLAGLPPFSFAIFQTTTEQEGFDNLNFTFAYVP